jgi:hypothetical protein
MNSKLTGRIRRVVEEAGYEVEVYDVDGSDVIRISMCVDALNFSIREYINEYARLGYHLMRGGYEFKYDILAASCDYLRGAFTIDSRVRVEFDIFDEQDIQNE